MIYLVTIYDKELFGEPDIAVAFVDALSEPMALSMAASTLNELAVQGRGRCVSSARPVALNTFYRLGALVRCPKET